MDGIIVVSTVAAVALARQRSAWYPWVLLAAGALVSVTANAIHAVVAADADVPGVLAASVAAVPPPVLLEITHLTVILTRPASDDAAAPDPVDAQDAPPHDVLPELRAVAPEPVPVPVPVRELAARLRDEEGWSNKAIARYLGVHPSTVGRWFARPGFTAGDTGRTAFHGRSSHAGPDTGQTTGAAGSAPRAGGVRPRSRAGAVHLGHHGRAHAVGLRTGAHGCRARQRGRRLRERRAPLPALE